MQSLDATSELLEASDATIDEAVQHADPMVLRGLSTGVVFDPAMSVQFPFTP